MACIFTVNDVRPKRSLAVFDTRFCAEARQLSCLNYARLDLTVNFAGIRALAQSIPFDALF